MTACRKYAGGECGCPVGICRQHDLVGVPKPYERALLEEGKSAVRISIIMGRVFLAVKDDVDPNRTRVISLGTEELKALAQFVATHADSLTPVTVYASEDTRKLHDRTPCPGGARGWVDGGRFWSCPQCRQTFDACRKGWPCGVPGCTR